MMAIVLARRSRHNAADGRGADISAGSRVGQHLTAVAVAVFGLALAALGCTSTGESAESTASGQTTTVAETVEAPGVRSNAQQPEEPAKLETRLVGEVVFEKEYFDEEYGRIWFDALGPDPEIVDGVLFIGGRDDGLQRFEVKLDAETGEMLDLAPRSRDYANRCGGPSRHIDLRVDPEAQAVVARDPWSGETLWTKPATSPCDWVIDDLGQVWEEADGELRRIHPNDGSTMWSEPLHEHEAGRRSWFTLPSTDGPSIVLFQGQAELVAVDAETGVQSWSLPFDRQPQCGFHRTGNMVWVELRDGGVVVIDATTGDERWRSEEIGWRVLYVSDQVVLVTNSGQSASCSGEWVRDGSVKALRADDGSVAWTDEAPANGALEFTTPALYVEPDPLGRAILLRNVSLDFDADDRATAIELTWIDEATGEPLSEPRTSSVEDDYAGGLIQTREPGLAYSQEETTIFYLDGTEFHTRDWSPEIVILVLDEYVLVTGLQLTAIR